MQWLAQCFLFKPMTTSAAILALDAAFLLQVSRDPLVPVQPTENPPNSFHASSNSGQESGPLISETPRRHEKKM
jgi:hypothetical protein